MVEVSTTKKRKNGEKIKITVILEDDLGKWLLTQPESVIHDFALFEYKNNCTDRAQYRRVQSLDASVDNGHDFEDESVNLMADLIRSEMKDAVEDAISRLMPKQQWIVRQVYFCNRKMSDVAEELCVSKSALSHQFESIYAKLKKYLKNF